MGKNNDIQTNFRHRYLKNPYVQSGSIKELKLVSFSLCNTENNFILGLVPPPPFKIVVNIVLVDVVIIINNNRIIINNPAVQTVMNNN